MLKKLYLTLPLMVCFFTTPLPAVSSESATVLCQKSGICGNVVIYASSRGLKLVHLSTNCVLIMKAPDWKVSYFNTDSKVLYETAPKNWQGKSSGFLAGLISASRFLALTEGKTKINAKSIAGLHCNETKMVRVGPLPPDTLKFKNELKSANYYGTTDIALPQMAAYVVQRFYRIPTLKGFPVRVEIFDLKGHPKNEVNTISCERLVCQPSWLTVPTGYRRVTSEEAVLAGHQSRLLEDLSGDLGSRLGSH